MKSLLNKTISNIVLFSLFGLSFAFPFKNLNIVADYEVEITFSIFPILLVIYIVGYLLLNYYLKATNKIAQKDNSELYFSDEREAQLVNKALKIAYLTLMTGLLIMTALLALFQIFTVTSDPTINTYQLSILLITTLLITTCLTYYMSYRKEYLK